MLATAQRRTSTALSVGDRVVIRRVLTHPAWMHRVDGRNVGMMYLPRTDIPELVGVSEVSEIRTRSAYLVENGDLVKVVVTEVQIKGSGFWFDANSGVQVHSGATVITRIDS